MDETEALDESAKIETNDAGSKDGASGDSASGHGTAGHGTAADPDSTHSFEDEAILKAVEQELSEELEEARSHEPIEPEVELQALRGELEVLQDRYLRTRAEYDNFRKRTGQELRSVWGRAQADMVESFLEALDDLQRVGTWDSSTTDLKALIEGVDLVERKFSQALGRAGVEAFDPLGEVFDPNTMEAMMKVPTEEEDQEDRVAEVFQKGYLLKGTLVRAARVGVYTSD